MEKLDQFLAKLISNQHELDGTPERIARQSDSFLHKLMTNPQPILMEHHAKIRRQETFCLGSNIRVRTESSYHNNNTQQNTEPGDLGRRETKTNLRDLNSPLNQFLCKYCHKHCVATVLSPEQERLECPFRVADHNQVHGSNQDKRATSKNGESRSTKCNEKHPSTENSITQGDIEHVILTHPKAISETKSYTREIARYIVQNPAAIHNEELMTLVARMRKVHTQAQETSHQLIPTDLVVQDRLRGELRELGESVRAMENTVSKKLILPYAEIKYLKGGYNEHNLPTVVLSQTLQGLRVSHGGGGSNVNDHTFKQPNEQGRTSNQSLQQRSEDIKRVKKHPRHPPTMGPLQQSMNSQGHPNYYQDNEGVVINNNNHPQCH